MSERLQWLGRLEERKQEAARLTMRLNSIRESIRLKLDPFEAPDEIDGDAVAELALEFSGTQIAYKAAAEEIKAINKALGRSNG